MKRHRALWLVSIMLLVIAYAPGATAQTMAVFPDAWARVQLTEYVPAGVGNRLNVHFLPENYVPGVSGSSSRAFLNFTMPRDISGKTLIAAELMLHCNAFVTDALGLPPEITAHFGFLGEVAGIVGHLAPEPMTAPVTFTGSHNFDGWQTWDVSAILAPAGEEVLFLVDPPAGLLDPWNYLFDAPDGSPIADPSYVKWPRLLLTYEDVHVPNTASSFSKIKSLYQ